MILGVLMEWWRHLAPVENVQVDALINANAFFAGMVKLMEWSHVIQEAMAWLL